LRITSPDLVLGLSLRTARTRGTHRVREPCVPCGTHRGTMRAICATCDAETPANYYENGRYKMSSVRSVTRLACNGPVEKPSKCQQTSILQGKQNASRVVSTRCVVMSTSLYV
jgi:hypothetical protein